MTLYLVTGGAGFIGSHITSALIDRGDRVRVFDNLSSGRLENLAHLERGPIGSGAPVEFVQADLADPIAIDAACAGVSGIFHEAAQVSVPQSIAQPARSYEVNVMGTLRLLEAARTRGVRRIVFAASSAAYGESETSPKVESLTPSPLSPYAAGKVAAEHLMSVYGHVHGLRTVSLRYFNVFGPRQVDDSPYTGVIAIFARALLEGRAPTIYGDGEQTRDFNYVDNVVQANLRAIECDVEPGIRINIGSGESISVNQLFDAMAAQLHSKVRPKYADPRPGDVRHSTAALERARTLLGYAPAVRWREGLARTIEWYAARFSSPRA